MLYFSFFLNVLLPDPFENSPMKISHMRCITKEKTALFIPNAIAIITSKKEYIFRSFWDREDAFRTLKACHQKSLTQPTTPSEASMSRDAGGFLGR